MGSQGANDSSVVLDEITPILNDCQEAEYKGRWFLIGATKAGDTWVGGRRS